jgi:hypothetical protein
MDLDVATELTNSECKSPSIRNSTNWTEYSVTVTSPLSTTFSQVIFQIQYFGSISQNFTIGLDYFSISPSSGFGDGDDGQPGDNGQPFFLKKNPKKIGIWIFLNSSFN